MHSIKRIQILMQFRMHKLRTWHPRDRSRLASTIFISVLSALHTAGAPVHRFPNLYQRHTCCVAANTQVAVSLQLPSAAPVQRYSSVLCHSCVPKTNFTAAFCSSCTTVQLCYQEAMYQFFTHRGSRNVPEFRSQYRDYATNRTIRSSSPGMDNRFIFLQNFQTGFVAHTASHCAGTGRAFSPGVRQLSREAEQSPPPVLPVADWSNS